MPVFLRPTVTGRSYGVQDRNQSQYRSRMELQVRIQPGRKPSKFLGVLMRRNKKPGGTGEGDGRGTPGPSIFSYLEGTL
jgi:hypothetical protein